MSGMGWSLVKTMGAPGFNLSNLNKVVIISAKKLISAYSIDVGLDI